MEDIRTYIGRPVEDYQVLSLGMVPAIPLFSGFHCADAYTVNYALAYKHAFREIIAGELA